MEGERALCEGWEPAHSSLPSMPHLPGGTCEEGKGGISEASRAGDMCEVLGGRCSAPRGIPLLWMPSRKGCEEEGEEKGR